MVILRPFGIFFSRRRPPNPPCGRGTPPPAPTPSRATHVTEAFDFNLLTTHINGPSYGTETKQIETKLYKNEVYQNETKRKLQKQKGIKYSKMKSKFKCLITIMISNILYSVYFISNESLLIRSER